MPISYIEIFRPECDAVDCKEEAKYERNIKVRDGSGEPLIFTAYFCLFHKDKANTPWDECSEDDDSSQP